MRLRCFVAMAIGRTDIDALYRNTILPTLRLASKSLSITMTPIRIDKTEFNSNIDIRILKEIRDADFVLSDLTYARPSVYFEAGFAERDIEVIYTCRHDHFKGSAGDEYGNLIVHFDLRQRNIIPWRTSRDRTFIRRLKERIWYVARPLVEKRKAEERRKKEQDKFSSLSIDGKRERVLSIARVYLRNDRYEVADSKKVVTSYWECVRQKMWGGIPDFYRPLSSILVPGLWAKRYSKGHLKVVIMFPVRNVTRNDVRGWNRLLSVPNYNLASVKVGGPLRKLEEHLVVFSVQNVPLPRIAGELSAFGKVGNGKSLGLTMKQLVPRGELSTMKGVYALGRTSKSFLVREGRRPWVSRELESLREIPRMLFVHVLDSIVSESDYKEKLNKSLRVKLE